MMGLHAGARTSQFGSRAGFPVIDMRQCEECGYGIEVDAKEAVVDADVNE